MSTSEGSIRASIELDIANYTAQVDAALAQTKRLGDGLKAIPDAKPTIKPPTEDADKTKKLAQEVADALGKLTGGRVELDIGQLETAGASAEKILGTLTAGLASTAATAAVASAAIVAAFLEIEHVLVEMGEHWEAAFRRVSVATGLTGHDLEAFEQTVVNVAKSSAASTDNIANAASTLQQRLGVTGPALEALTTNVTKFARVTGQDAGDAAKALSQILTQFHIPVEQAAATMDNLFRVSQATGIGMDQLETLLKGRMGPTLQALGFDATGAAVLLANLTRQGDAGRAAFTAFNKILQEAADAGKDPQVVFRELVEQLKATGDTSTVAGAALAQKLGPSYGIVSAAAKNGLLDINAGSAAIKASGDTVNEAFDRMRSGAEKIGDQLTILKNQFAPIGIEIAKVINQLETDFAGAIAKVTAQVKALQEQIAKLPIPPQAPAAVGAVSALALGPAGLPIAAGIISQAGQTPAEEPHGAEPAHGAPGVAPGVPEAAKAAQIETANLSTEITKLQKNLEDTHGNQAQIEALLRQKQTLEETEKAISALPPALAALALAQVSAAEAVVEDAKARAAQADSSKAAIAQATEEQHAAAEAAAAQVQAADAEVQAVLRADEAKARQAQTQELLTRAYGQYAAVQTEATVDAEKYAAAVAALNTAQAAYDAAAQAATAASFAGIAATIAQIDAANKLATAKNKLKETEDAVIVSGAAYAVKQERTNAIIGAAKPLLDAQQEAAIKVAEAHGKLEQAITIAGHAMGLTDAQIQALIGSLGASQQKFDQTTNSIKALTIPTETLQARLNELATGAYPNLSKAQADALQAIIKSGDATKESAALAAYYGVTVEELNQHLDDSKAHFDEWAKGVEAAHRPLADFVSDENKSRISSVLGTLASATDSVTAAQAKQAEQSGHADQALALLLQHAGAGPAAITALTQALQEGGAAAFDAQEKIKALVTYARDPSTGTIRLKVDIDIDAAQKAIYDLQNSYQKAQQERADAETKATHEFQIQQDALAQQQGQVQSDYRDSVLAISKAREESSQQLGRDIQTANDAANKASRSADQSIEDAKAKHDQAVQDAKDKYVETVANAVDTFNKGVEGLADRARSIIQQTADAAQAAFRQVSSAMQSFNDQARITANQTSIQAQTAQLASYGFTDFQSQQSALRAAQIQAEGTAGLAQVAGQNQLNQTLVGANQALQKATEKAADDMEKLSKDLQALQKTYQKTLDQAAKTEAKTIRDADEAEAKAVRDATTKVSESIRVEDKAIETAQDAETKRQQALDEKAQQEQQKFYDQLIKDATERGQDPEGKFRTKQEQAFDDAEKARREAQRKADEQYLEQLKRADATLAALLALKDLPEQTAEAIVQRFNASPQQFTYNGLTLLETQIDFQAAATAELARRVRSRT